MVPPSVAPASLRRARWPAIPTDHPGPLSIGVTPGCRLAICRSASFLSSPSLAICLVVTASLPCTLRCAIPNSSPSVRSDQLPATPGDRPDRYPYILAYPYAARVLTAWRIHTPRVSLHSAYPYATPFPRSCVSIRPVLPCGRVSLRGVSLRPQVSLPAPFPYGADRIPTLSPIPGASILRGACNRSMNQALPSLAAEPDAAGSLPVSLAPVPPLPCVAPSMAQAIHQASVLRV